MNYWALLLLFLHGGEFPPEHRLGSILDGVSPDVLLIQEGNLNQALSHQPLWELYPLVKISLPWSISAEYVQKRDDAVLFEAQARGLAVGGERRPARLLQEGFLIMGQLDSQEEKRIVQWLFFPRLEGYADGIITPAEWRVSFQGRPGPVFESIDLLTFGGGTAGYIARRGGVNWFVVVSERVFGPYNQARHLVISPGGEHFAFLAEKGGRWRIQLDGKPWGEEFEDISWPVFSSDARRLAAAVRKDACWHLLADEKIFGSYDRMEEPVFSPRGEKIACLATRAGDNYLLVDGREVFRAEEIRFPVWSPDGKRLAFAARRGGCFRLVADGRESDCFDQVDVPVFSPDSLRLAARVRKGVEWRLWLDGKLPADFQLCSEPLFSPDSKHFAVCVLSGTRQRVLLDGQVGPEFDWVGRLRFSDSSDLLGYGAQAGGESWWKVMPVPRGVK